MSTISQQIADNLVVAMKAKDSTTTTLLRSLMSAFKYTAIEKPGASPEDGLDDADAIAVIRKQIKQRQDSIESFKEGNRDDLVEKEQAEIDILEKFLPAALAADEITALVEASIAEAGATSKKEMGAVMKILQEKIAGRADNKTLSQEVMKRLG